MRIISLNVNGLRSAVRKGLWPWLATEMPDVICLQETKVQYAQLPENFIPPEYHAYFHDAEKPGYSGVAILTRHKPDRVTTGLGFDLADKEGRYIQADFGEYSIASLYLPSGSSGEARQACKFDFMKIYEKILQQQYSSQRQHIICGDWNIVHKQIDIKNWSSNQKNSGCLPEERTWLDQLLQEQWVDAFRVYNQEPHQYTWWSNRGQAWANNVGWRIDYQIISPALAKLITNARIYKTERFSDHAPLIIDYSCELSQ